MSLLYQISGCENASRKADVIFVHGLGGDAFGTWCSDKEASNSWLHWLGDDFPEVGVWSLAYPSSPSRWARFLGWFSEGWRDAGHSMSLPDRALQVLDLMVLRGLGSRPLLFICHSLGGLVAKQILRKSVDATDPRKKQIADQTRAVLFLATPHAGAELASLFNTFRIVFGPTVSIDDLRANDAHLRDLYDWYRNHAAVLGIETVTYYEQRGIKGVLPIVDPTSSHPGVGADPVGLDEDHLSIAKLRSRDAQVYGAVRDLLRIRVLLAGPTRQSQSPPMPVTSPRLPQEFVIKVETAGAAGSDTRRIPHELPPGAEQFFGRETERKQLIERLRSRRNTAVVGPAGLGKTAAAAEAVRAVVGDTAVTLASSPFPEGVVFLDLYTFRGQAEPAWNTLANRLAGGGFMERSPARDRAAEACRARRVLVVIEGGEEADGTDGRSSIKELFSVLSPENRWLLLTRLSTQAASAETVELREALHRTDAANLLDSLTRGRVTGAMRARLLEMLEGHPLALTWAGNLLARDDDDPGRLVGDWGRDQVPKLSDPTQAEHTLEWLFNRSVRGLNDAARLVLAAAGLLSREPLPLMVMRAALGESTDDEAPRDALKSLVQRGLLRRSDEADHWQFTHVLGYRFARKEIGSDPALRVRMGYWLQGHLKTILGALPSDEWTVLATRSLEHAAALLRADDDQQLWTPLASYVLYDGCGRLKNLGQLPLQKLAVNAVAGWFRRFPAEKAEQPGWLREHSSLSDRQGDVLHEQGDHLAGALAAYRESCAVMRRLAAADPTDVGWQRDLSVSQQKVGDVLRDQGDLAGALVAYHESLAARQSRASADPSNELWQHDLISSQERVGDVLREQGDLVEALAAYRGALAVMRGLVAADSSNWGWHRDLSVSQNKVGDVLRDQGDLAEALITYRESLAVIQQLAIADPNDAGWQRDLSVSHNKVGDVLRDQGDLAGALAAYRASVDVRQRLAVTDPSNASWQRDLSVSQERVAVILHDQGDLVGALAAHRASLTTRQRLAMADPSNAIWQRDLSAIQQRVGDLLRDQGDIAGALAAYRESLPISKRLAATDPSNAGRQRDLSFSLTRIAEFHEQLNQCTEALALAEESLEIDERLAALASTNVTWQHDVTVSRALVARLQTRQSGDDPRTAGSS